MNYGRGVEENDCLNGIRRKLPVLKSKQLGTWRPGFGLGAGCGIGLGLGLTGGIGFGPSVPGLQLGIGFGAGCGVGFGFGYGYGIGKFSASDGNLQRHLPSQYELSTRIDELAMNTKTLVRAMYKAVEKWKRF